LREKFKRSMKINVFNLWCDLRGKYNFEKNLKRDKVEKVEKQKT
jgi:hypothetical protein